VNIPKLIKKHYDFALGFIIFILYRYYFNFLLFKGRGVPPEPDDSYFYLASAANALNPQTFEDFRLLPFSIWLRVISFFTGGNLEAAYQVNFYIGPVLMFVSIAYFLHKIEPSKKIRLLLFAILTLYSGSGSYHGFYWVVPSFYQLALFFVLIPHLFTEEPIKLERIFPLSLAFIFIHPTSILISLSFLLYPLFYILIKKKFELQLLKNSFIIILSISISYLLYFLIGSNFPHEQSPESFQGNLKLISGFLSGNLRPDSFPVIWSEYFSIFLFHPVSILAFLLVFYFVWKSKQFKILAIFFSTLSMVLLSSFIPYGWRTLGFLWPLTFLLIGYALAALTKNFSNRKNFKVSSITLAFVFLLSITTLFNHLSISSINLRKNYFWDRNCVLLLKEQEVYFPNLESSFAFTAWGLDRNDARLLNDQNKQQLYESGGYVVSVRQEPLKFQRLSKPQEFLSSLITRNKENKIEPKLDNLWHKKLYHIQELQLEDNGLKTISQKDCGHFSVSKLEKI
jgi:hypothetical protein